MVRLKDDIFECSWEAQLAFQFLMVRLKVFVGAAVAFGTHVSIPYGSIKSVNAGEKAIPIVVSIPYGSIKSLMRRDDGFVVIRFNSLWFD